MAHIAPLRYLATPLLCGRRLVWKLGKHIILLETSIGIHVRGLPPDLECLNENWFNDLAERAGEDRAVEAGLQQKAPASSLQYRTPVEFAAQAGASAEIRSGQEASASLAFLSRDLMILPNNWD